MLSVSQIFYYHKQIWFALLNAFFYPCIVKYFAIRKLNEKRSKTGSEDIHLGARHGSEWAKFNQIRRLIYAGSICKQQTNGKKFITFRSRSLQVK
jgi:hypothetical protein